MKSREGRGRSKRAIRAAGVRVVAAAAVVAALGVSDAAASHSQPTPDPTKMRYAYADGGAPPAGAGFKFATTPGVPGDQLPPADQPPAPTAGKRYYNPSGLFLAYDTNVFETLALPYRAANDRSATDPPGNGGNPQHGFCAPSAPNEPAPSAAAGRCPNHQLEYLDYYEQAMRDILGPFGVTIKRYEFQSPGSSNTDAGRSFNISATVPGADHPDESIVVSGHFDQTRDGPASGWDSAEGHAEVIRMAKIMADYWRATGTRPSATVKFVPWDQEESGTLGSIDFVENKIPPGEERKVRGYFNVDPCAGGYPAFRRGIPSPGNRVPATVQVADPTLFDDEPAVKARFQRFNARADQMVEQAFDYMDDRLLNTPGQPEVFVSNAEAAAEGKPSQRPETPISSEGPLLFTSDYANFEAVGIPFFNFGPDYTGPGNQGSPGSPEGLAILHTPNDNLTTINALTSLDQTGRTASEGWAKGQEMCAQVESWYMLQPDMGGAQRASSDVVAYYEALPNEAVQRQRVTFDASGSYQYADAGARRAVSDVDLTYSWDFGDGRRGSGKTVRHAYAAVGRYESRLTVRNRRTGATDTMRLPVTVIGSNFAGPRLARPAAQDADGTFPLSWTFSGTRSGFREFAVEESADVRTVLGDNADAAPSERWAASKEPAGEGRVEPWQPSDSATPKARGNQSRSGRSYWTGVKPQDFPQAPTNARSVLTLKDPVTVPRAGGDVELTFWSLFQNEGDDQGRVEVAVVDDDPRTPEEFEPVDVSQATNTAVGESDPLIFSPADPATLREGFRLRRANLASFKGQKLRVRFVYQLGPDDRAASQPAGWYIDDIRVQYGTWRPIGTTASTSFQVFGKPAGTFSYRIKGRYADGVETAPSNWETVRVTQGVRAGSAEPVGGSCATGFRAVSATPRGRGLRFAARRRTRRPFDVTVYQRTAGRRVTGNRAVARFKGRRKGFTWSGRRGARSGYYFARFRMALPGRRVADVRDRPLRRVRGRFRRLPRHDRGLSCGLLRRFGLSAPVFGGRTRKPVGIVFQLRATASVSVVVTRGRRRVLSIARAERLPGVAYRLRLASRGLRRGDYRVRITVTRGGRKISSRVVARRI